MHWTARWLGRPWVAGVHQCEDFVHQVLKAEFGLEVPRDLRGSAERGWDRQLREHRDRYWRRVDEHAAGDVVLMVDAGGRGRRFYHVGVWVDARPPAVLHCPRDGVSVCQPLLELPAQGLAVEGVYRWAG